LALGFIKAGTISNYFPTNVIEGMLAGIGVIIFLKQIPKALGSDVSVGSGLQIFTDVAASFGDVKMGVVIVTLISLAIILVWDKIPALKNIKMLPAALIAVTVGIVINEFLFKGTSLEITDKYLVSLPVPTSAEEFKAIIVTPDFSGFVNPKVWMAALTIAIVASIESLLCIEAADRMDVQKRYTDTNVELKAQGIGNVVSALLGGLPMTSVVVRSSANANAGAKSKMSAVIHGVLLLISVLTIPVILNKIPFATLAAILLLIGYKLAKPSVFKHFWDNGKYQFVPFIATFGAVVFLDLLKGVALGMIISVVFILKGNMQRAYKFRKEEYHDGDVIHIDLAQEVSFLNKSAIKATIAAIPENSKVVINASDTVYIAHDVLDLIKEFKKIRSKDENIKVKLVGFKKSYNLVNTGEEEKHVFVEHKV
jgi:MFS superfamily sulfate permease-like transporter